MAGGPPAQAVQHRARGYRGGQRPARPPRECERRSSRCVASTEMSEAITYPGARRPDRQRTVDSHGLAIAVHEWGDESAPADPARATGAWTSPAPSTCSRRCSPTTGFRVVSWDHRGHGDSQHAALYNWEADLRDSVMVFDSVTADAVLVIGHSKGGSLMLQLADALPHRVSHLINLDGLPSRRSFPDVSDHQRTKLMAKELTGWLDYRRSLVDAAAPAGHDRRAGRAAPAHEPAARPGLAALPRHRRRPGGRRRLALEDRPHDALRRLRPVAAGVVDDAAARHRRPGAGRARHRARPDGVGHAASRTCCRTCRRAVGSRCSTTSATSSTSSSRGRSPTSCWSTWRERRCSSSTTRSSSRSHELRAGAGRPLLHLHGLAERTPDDGARPPGGLAGPGVGPRPVRSRRLVGRRRAAATSARC